jgi:hypothetical protein
MSPYRLLFAALGAAMFLLTGCHPYALADDIDIDFDFSPLSGPSDALHVPYVQGAQVSLWVRGTSDAADRARFTLKSADPSILRIDAQSDANATCTAVGAGTVEVKIMRDGEEVYSTEIAVKVPTRAVLTPNGPLIVGQPSPQPATSTTNVLAGGTSTYLVEYFAGDEQLYGNGVLFPTAPDGVVAENKTSFLFENREWLQITPSATGKQTVTLSGGGAAALGTLTVNTVDETAVARVTIEAEDASGARDGTQLAVLAQSFDAKGDPIFGVDYTWARGGVEETGEGDLFRFDFDGSRSDTLTAHFGAMSASTEIQAAPNSGFVDSSNRIGCTVRALPGAPANAFPGLALAVMAAGIVVRARRRRVS